MLGFTKTPARWADAERGIHAALINVGVPIDEAVTYTLHSFKHLFVTAGRQLQIPEPAIDLMSGWTVKSTSGMASIYDSVKASSELLYKDFIHKELSLFSVADNQRSIPSIVAGLTPSQRKVMFACFKRKLKREGPRGDGSRTGVAGRGYAHRLRCRRDQGRAARGLRVRALGLPPRRHVVERHHHWHGAGAW